MSRVLIVGLDGADFQLIHPFVAQGKLPHLAKLLQTGSWGLLESTVPPMSPPAWTSFMTGKNPGKHGIFDFTARKQGSYAVEFANASFRRALSMWRLMSDAGKRVGVMSVPFSFPPEKLNGFMISGIDTPGVTGGFADPSAFHPTSLHQELTDKVGGYLISSPKIREIGEGGWEDMMEGVLMTIDRKLGSARYLYSKEAWDCFMCVIGETDAIAHRLWKYHDTSCPLAGAEEREYEGPNPLLRIYERADEHLGKLLEASDGDTNVIVVSDHGHGGNTDKVIYLNNWLEEAGLLRFNDSLLRKAVTWLFALAKRTGTRSTIPVRYRKQLFRKTKLASRVESWLRFGHIDWNRTRAYSEETPYYPTIWINLQGRDPSGCVRPGEEYEQVRDTLIKKLLEWKDPETGEKVVRRVHKREELYSGPYVQRSADLVLEWNLDNGYSYGFKASQGEGRKQPPLARLSPDQRLKVKSGDHRDFGVFIASGPDVAAGAQLEGARLMDIAPTVLHMLGLEVPRDMDGRVLSELFTEEHRGRHEVRLSDAKTDIVDPDQPPEYSEADEETMRERLRGLGYLE